jgi:hypothetical protein
MNKLVFLVYLLSLIGLITSACDCCDQCGTDSVDDVVVEHLSGSCPELTYVSGGMSGNGYATRYWDCCKPSCSWSANAGWGNEARQCDSSMKRIYDTNARSMCDGGPSTTCLDQIPFTIDGCDELGFAFSSVPGNGPNVCGKCFLLEFTGEGKYETKLNHRKLKGKKLVVMASNIGYDVVNNQFDLMIPGGGVGIFNGCAGLFGNNLGAQYGGLLSECENEVGYGVDDNSMYTQRKECLVKKCNSVFSGKTAAKEGCLFLANYMEAAGNPLHTFRQVECPQVLKDRY